MAAVVLVNGSSLSWAVASAEVGVNIDTFEMSVAPQFIESLPDYQNITRCDAYGPCETTLTMNGETNGAGTGSVLLAVIGTAFVPVNSLTTYFSAPSTGSGLMLQSGQITLSRGSFVRFNAEFKKKAGV